ncbi:hypothetical protein CLV49_1496 [Labedella gwakjiensis]|uniref:Uncharacterized protein n=1 Tax=Labedella gwakjiensis TaxID=390269 RepID=A0A2P8GVA1_9MICO|nr:hypothetical protein [Labedella gwakjiensis]PSL37889.1 hypothetical protein CLV49_1496 [Labedella gwakjiensis]RUQ87541.1 hypothetical protein ELQ93_11720 [Labedella gwakjiensis]
MPDFSPAADTYLSRLSTELRDVREPLRGDIWSGIAEELDGLAETEARGRIAELGDPAFIAREAVEAGDGRPDPETGQPSYVTVTERIPLAESPKFAVAAAITLGIGGFVLPFIGYLVGVVLVWTSTLWTRGEKAIATIGPFVITVLAAYITHVIGAMSSSAEDSGNPLVPAVYDFLWTSVIGAALLSVVAMGWLLVRLRRR